MGVKAIGSLAALMLMAGCGGGEAPRVADAAPDALEEFVVLAGHWTVAEDAGGRVLRLDGSSWTPGTPPDDLSRKAAALFPGNAAAFEQRVRAGLQFPYVVWPSTPTFSDGWIQVDFKLVGGASDQFAAILFGLNDDGNHHAFRYNTRDGDTALWKVVDGERVRIHHGGVHIDVPLGEWRTLRMRVEGATITGWVNDTEALRFTLPAPVSGRVGLWSKADSVTDYRRFNVVQ